MSDQLPVHTVFPSGESPDVVLVVDPDDHLWRIHRQDADPEHRSIIYRLAAGWFGNLPADCLREKTLP